MWKAKIFNSDFLDGEKLVLYLENFSGAGTISILQADGKTMKTYSSTEAMGDVTLCLPRGAAEAILNALLERGVKPKEQSRVEGMLEATRAHLEDMRRLVFKEKK